MFILRFLLCGTYKPAPLVQFRAASQTRGAGLLLQGQRAKPQTVAGLLCHAAPPWAQPSPWCQTHLHVFPCGPAFQMFVVFFLISAHWLKPPLALLISHHHWISIALWSPASNVLEKSAVCLLFCFPALTILT